MFYWECGAVHAVQPVDGQRHMTGRANDDADVCLLFLTAPSLFQRHVILLYILRLVLHCPMHAANESYCASRTDPHNIKFCVQNCQTANVVSTDVLSK